MFQTTDLESEADETEAMQLLKEVKAIWAKYLASFYL